MKRKTLWKSFATALLADLEIRGIYFMAPRTTELPTREKIIWQVLTTAKVRGLVWLYRSPSKNLTRLKFTSAMGKVLMRIF